MAVGGAPESRAAGNPVAHHVPALEAAPPRVPGGEEGEVEAVWVGGAQPLAKELAQLGAVQAGHARGVVPLTTDADCGGTRTDFVQRPAAVVKWQQNPEKSDLSKC